MSLDICESDSDCSDILYICLNNICEHKYFWPVSYHDILTIILVFVSSIITTVAGVGGGIFFFPILLGLQNLATTPAVATSLSMVMVLMIIRYLMSYKEKHPCKDRPIINYDISLIYCPSSVVGTIFGVLLNRTSPNWVLLLLILISLGVSAKETWEKAMKQREKEKELADEFEKTLFINPSTNESSSPENFAHDNKSLKTILEAERKTIPWKKLTILIINLIVLIILILMQGSKTAKSIIGLELCGVWFWIFQFLYIPFGICILFFCVRILNAEHEEKKNAGYQFIDSDIEWDRANIKKSLVLGFLIGFTSSILGVGGAVVTSPILISLGLDAREATFTATFIAVFTSISGSVQYLFANEVVYDYAGACLFVGLFGLWIGMRILDYVKRTKRTSIIMFTLCGSIVLTMILIMIPGVRNCISDYEKGAFFDLRKYC